MDYKALLAVFTPKVVKTEWYISNETGYFLKNTKGRQVRGAKLHSTLRKQSPEPLAEMKEAGQ